MKTGVTTSVIAHTALLIIALVGIGSAKPLEPEIVESIAVDLVPISEVTNIRMGSLDSTVVETETPAVVESEKPAELAKPTGNTEEDQVTPQETDTETPAPVVNTAPEPAPEPAPETAPVEDTPPEPVPAVEPEPAPVEEAPPEEVVAEAPAEQPAKVVAPMPAMRPAQLQKAPTKKPAETKVAEVKPAPKTPSKTETPKQDPKKAAPDQPTKEADLNDLIQNLEKSRGATTGEGGTPTLGKNDGRAATLTQSQLDGLIAKIRSCFYLSPSMMDSTDTTRLVFALDGAGNLKGDPQITEQLDTTTGRALASAAKRAIMKCGPYPMAAGQDVGATFTTDQLT